MYPEIQEHVSALITVQSPIGGSVLAVRSPLRKFKSLILLTPFKLRQDDFLNSSSVGRSLLDLMFVKHVSGDYRCILDLTIAERKKLLEQFPLHKRLRVPMLNFASHISSSHNNRYYKGLYDYSKVNYGLEGDGFVAVNDAIVPAYPYVNTPGISHIGTGSMLGVQFGQERIAAADIHHALAFLAQDVIKSHQPIP
jgi:triacylglycerol lipase